MIGPTSRAFLSVAILTIGGAGAAFAAASCCGLPFLLASTGSGFAWLTGLAIFSAPYGPLLLTGAAICLVGGATCCGDSAGPRGPAALIGRP
jgi:mercuric ion transport protein